MNILPHAYYSEIIQTVAAILGFAFGIWAIWDAWKDEQFWKKVLEDEERMGRSVIITHARYVIARVYVQSELATVVAYVILLVAGVSGLFLPPPEWFESFPQNMLGITISRYAMTMVTIVLALKTSLRRRGRIEYIRTIRSTDRKDEMRPPHEYTIPQTDSEDS